MKYHLYDNFHLFNSLLAKTTSSKNIIQDAKVKLQSLSHELVALSVLRLNVFLLLRDVYYTHYPVTHTPQKSEDQTLADEHMQDTIVWEFSPISFLGTLA